jgi:PIN domain nuclease of toxin-antitoxin system
MRLLLDAHALIWAVDDPSRLSSNATAAIQDPANELLLGTGTIWEIGIKVGLNKLRLTSPFKDWINQAIAALKLSVLPIGLEHVDVQVGLPRHHGDPFDRILVAQALAEALEVISADPALKPYGIALVW